MMTDDIRDKLEQTLAICDLHYERMMFAFTSVESHFPLTEISFGEISPIELACSTS